jgi:hypothetical protein
VVLNGEVRDGEEVWGAFIGSFRRFGGKFFCACRRCRRSRGGRQRCWAARCERRWPERWRAVPAGFAARVPRKGEREKMIEILGRRSSSAEGFLK